MKRHAIRRREPVLYTAFLPDSNCADPKTWVSRYQVMYALWHLQTQIAEEAERTGRRPQFLDLPIPPNMAFAGHVAFGDGHKARLLRAYDKSRNLYAGRVDYLVRI